MPNTETVILLNAGKIVVRTNNNLDKDLEYTKLSIDKIIELMEGEEGNIIEKVKEEYYQLLVLSESELLEFAKKVYQGGLSDDVFESEENKEFISQYRGKLNYGYYLLTHFREEELDKYIEKEFLRSGLSSGKIALLLESKGMEYFFEEINGNLNPDDDERKDLNFCLSLSEKKKVFDKFKEQLVKDGLKLEL